MCNRHAHFAFLAYLLEISLTKWSLLYCDGELLPGLASHHMFLTENCMKLVGLRGYIQKQLQQTNVFWLVTSIDYPDETKSGCSLFRFFLFSLCAL